MNRWAAVKCVCYKTKCQAEQNENLGYYCCYYDYWDGPSGCVYMMYADEGSEVRPT